MKVNETILFKITYFSIQLNVIKIQFFFLFFFKSIILIIFGSDFLRMQYNNIYIHIYLFVLSITNKIKHLGTFLEINKEIKYKHKHKHMFKGLKALMYVLFKNVVNKK